MADLLQMLDSSRVSLEPGDYKRALELARSSGKFSDLSALVVDATGSREWDVFRILKKVILNLGPVYVASLLKSFGFKDVKAVYECLTPNFDYSELDPDLIGVSAILNNMPFANQKIRYFKKEKPNALIIAGGAGYSIDPEAALESGADAVILGKADYPLLELLKRIVEQSTNRNLRAAFYHSDISGIPGVYTRRTRSKELAPVVKDLDEIPDIDFNLIQGEQSRLSRSLISSDGCVHGCDFCSSVLLNSHVYRSRSPERVLEEMKAAKLSGIRQVFFVDDHAFGRAYRQGGYENLVKFLNEIKKADLGWVAQATVDSIERFIDKGIIDLLAESNCNVLCLGVESIDENAMSQVHSTKSSYTQLKRVLEAVKNTPIEIHAMLMIKPFVKQGMGSVLLYSTEDTEDGIIAYRREMIGTVDFLIANGVRSAQFHASSPSPGTKYARDCFNAGIVLKKVGGKPLDWTKFTGQYVIASSNPFESNRIMEETYDRFYSYGNIFAPCLEIFRQPFGRTLMDVFYKGYGRVVAHVYTHGKEAKRYTDALKRGDFEFYKPEERFIVH